MSAQPASLVQIPRARADLSELRRLVAQSLRDGSTPMPWRAEGEKCQECARSNPCWWIQQDLWNAVMIADREAIICPPCFIRRAERTGVGRHGAWQLYPPAGLF